MLADSRSCLPHLTGAATTEEAVLNRRVYIIYAIAFRRLAACSATEGLVSQRYRRMSMFLSRSGWYRSTKAWIINDQNSFSGNGIAKVRGSIPLGSTISRPSEHDAASSKTVSWSPPAAWSMEQPASAWPQYPRLRRADGPRPLASSAGQIPTTMAAGRIDAAFSGIASRVAQSRPRSTISRAPQRPPDAGNDQCGGNIQLRYIL